METEHVPLLDKLDKIRLDWLDKHAKVFFIDV